MAETLQLQDRRLRRAEWIQRIPLALSALVLAEAALPRLAGPARGDQLFAVAELATAVLLVVVLGVAWRQRHRPPAALGWVDLAAAAMLFAEWGDRLAHGGKRFSPVLLTALVALALGLGYRPFLRFQEGRRCVRIDEEGLRFRLSLLRRFVLSWPDLASVERSGAALVLHRRDGREHRIPLGRLDNGEEVARRVTAAAARVGVAVRSGTDSAEAPFPAMPDEEP